MLHKRTAWPKVEQFWITSSLLEKREIKTSAFLRRAKIRLGCYQNTLQEAPLHEPKIRD
jgi:hypothetical protein